MVQFYKSDVQVVAGRTAIGSVRLKENSLMIRCFCLKCGTPLGADVGPGPVVLIDNTFLSTGFDTVFLPSLVLNMASALPECKSYDRRTTVRQGLFAPVFFLRAVARILLGFLFGKGKGGFLENDYSSVPVGIDTIAYEARNKKSE